MKDGGPRIKLRNYSGRIIEPSVGRYAIRRYPKHFLGKLDQGCDRYTPNPPGLPRVSGPAGGTIFPLAEIENKWPRQSVRSGHPHREMRSMR